MNDFKYPVYATFHAEEKLRGILAMLKEMIFQESHTLLITDKKNFLTFKIKRYFFDRVGQYYSHRLYFAQRRFTNIL